MVSNSDLAYDYAHGTEKGKGSNMFIEDNVIYSWGHHFPMAVRLSNGSYLFNTDKYSKSTSDHQSCVRSAITDYIECDTETIKHAVDFPSEPIVVHKLHQHSTLQGCMDNLKAILNEKGIKRVPIKKWTAIITNWSVAKAINVE
jgi:hypothetical protein